MKQEAPALHRAAASDGGRSLHGWIQVTRRMLQFGIYVGVLAEDGEKAASAAGSSGDEAAQAYSAPAVQKPADIETLSQMLRYMETSGAEAASLVEEKCPRSKILRMPLAELAAICQAAARVKYYEASAFGERERKECERILPSRSSERPDPSDIAGIVAGLASVNAYDAELFEAAAQILQKHFGTALDRPLRRQIVDAYKKVSSPSVKA
eukprot:721271-Amphidinium_carterae.2